MRWYFIGLGALVCWYLFAAQTVAGALLVLTLGLVVPGYRKIDLWAAQRRKRRRLLADAEIQHAAWRRGDDRTAFFGRWQPPPEMYAPTSGTGRPPPPPINWETEQIRSIP